jgi:hypothetical protein
MIEPFLWAILCGWAIAVAWTQIRTGGALTAIGFSVMALAFASSGWGALQSLIVALETISEGGEVQPYRETLIVAAPLGFVLMKPALQGIIQDLAHFVRA